MNWNPFKKKKEEPEALDPLSVTLSDLKLGYVLDYDLKTWQVTAQHYYDYEGDRVDEWELTCGDDVAFLERSEDDSISWILTRKIPLSDIEGDIRGHMRDHDNEDPPDEVRCHGVMSMAYRQPLDLFTKMAEMRDRSSSSGIISTSRRNTPCLSSNGLKTLLKPQWVSSSRNINLAIFCQ